MSGPNIHATALVIGDRGILITGASGSGKTTLALALIDRARTDGRFGRLVADDQLLLSISGGRILAHTPKTIAGLVEVRGLGPQPVAVETAAVLDLAISLQAPENAPRLQETGTFNFETVQAPLLLAPARNVVQSVGAVLAWLGWAPFA